MFFVTSAHCRDSRIMCFTHIQRKPAVIESWQYESKDYRKIRLTYIDAGIGAQVFNSVWYPRYNNDAPIFGIDFLAFGPKKVISIMQTYAT